MMKFNCVTLVSVLVLILTNVFASTVNAEQLTIDSLDAELAKELSPSEYEEWKQATDDEKEKFSQYISDEVDNENILRVTPINRRTKRTAVENKTVNDGVGRLFVSTSFVEGGLCTASYVGGRWWITAAHCVHNRLNNIGFIKQSDGQYAGIERMYEIMDSDVALVRVGGGISANEWRLADYNATKSYFDRYLERREQVPLNVIGFSINHYSYSSQSDVFSRSMNERTIQYLGYPDYKYQFDYSTDYISRTLGGDSGAPVFKDNTIYGVHSGSNNNGYSNGTFIYHHIHWVNERKQQNSNVTYGDRWRAYKGGNLAVLDSLKLVPENLVSSS